MAKKSAPFGTWKSPITTDMVASGGVKLSGVIFDGDDLYWLEGRAAEGGRQVIVHRSADGDSVRDVLPKEFNARTTVHEYGGGAFAVSKGTIVLPISPINACTKSSMAVPQ